jgi:predicted glutamine amidotransferase
MLADFSRQTGDGDVVTIIATDPLTSNEHWHRMHWVR